MAFFWTTRAKPSGWAFGEILTSAQMNTVDAQAAQCPEEFPSNVTVLGGVFVTGDSNFSGAITAASIGTTGTIQAPLFIGDSIETTDLEVFGESTLAGDVNIGSSDTDDIQVYGTTTFNESFECTTDAQVNGTFGVGGDLNVAGTADIDELVVENLLQAQGVIDSIAGLRTAGRLGTNGAFAIDPDTMRDVYIAFGALSADRTYTVPVVGAGAVNGSEVIITSDDTAYIVTVEIVGGGTLANLSGPPGFGRPRQIRAKVISGSWRVLDHEYWP